MIPVPGSSDWAATPRCFVSRFSGPSIARALKAGTFQGLGGIKRFVLCKGIAPMPPCQGSGLYGFMRVCRFVFQSPSNSTSQAPTPCDPKSVERLLRGQKLPALLSLANAESSVVPLAPWSRLFRITGNSNGAGGRFPPSSASGATRGNATSVRMRREA